MDGQRHDGNTSGAQGTAAIKLFLAQLPGAFVYPLRGGGKSLIIAGGVFFGLLDFVRWIVGLLPVPFLSIVARVALGIIACILPAYVLEVIGRSAAGEDEPPGWPPIADWREDLVRPALLILAAVAVSVLPAVACRIALAQEWMHSSTPTWIFVGVAVLHLPMALLAVALFQGVAGLNPLVVFPAIGRTAPAYLVACATLAGIAGIWIVVVRFLSVPIPGLGAVAPAAISIFLLMIQMRILGLMYNTYEQRLGWFAVRRTNGVG